MKVKEHPILFTADMVKAILSGKKTQTRRLIKPQPELITKWADKDKRRTPHWQWTTAEGRSYSWSDNSKTCLSAAFAAKYQPGDKMEVWEVVGRERCPQCEGTSSVSAKGSGCPTIWEPCPNCEDGWVVERRFTGTIIEITAVRCERVQEISADDVKVEGIELEPFYTVGETSKPGAKAQNDRWRMSEFQALWQSIYPGSWEKNEYVWVYEFKVVDST